MATLTIRNLDERLKGRLRVRAASRGHSMEEEARQILRAALNEGASVPVNLAERIRRRFEAFGDVQLPIAGREPIRDLQLPEDIGEDDRKLSARSDATKKRRRA